MAYTVRYANFDLGTGNNDGTTEADAWQTLADMNTGLAGGGFLCHIKKQAARPTIAANQIMCPDALIGNPNIIRGYGTTINDGVRWEFGTPSWRNIYFNAHTTWDFVDFDGPASLRANGKPGSCLKRSRIIQNDGGVEFATFDSNYIELSGGSEIQHGAVGGAPCRLFRNYIRKTDTNASQLAELDMFGHSLTIIDNIFHGNGSAGQDGITVDRHNNSDGLVIANNIIYNCDQGISFGHIENDNVARLSHIYGNLFDTMAGYAIEAPTTVVGQNRLMNNYYRNCTSGFTDYPDESTDGPAIALTADPFVDTSTNDLTINDTVGGGRVLRDAGFAANLAGGAMLNRPFGSFLSQLGGASPTPAHWG